MCLSGDINGENLSMDVDLTHFMDSNAASGLCPIHSLEFTSGHLDWLKLQNNVLRLY